MSGGPYGPRGVLSDFGGGEGVSPNPIIGQTLFGFIFLYCIMNVKCESNIILKLPLNEVSRM